MDDGVFAQRFRGHEGPYHLHDSLDRPLIRMDHVSHWGVGIRSGSAEGVRRWRLPMQGATRHHAALVARRSRLDADLQGLET
jgi:hypothetical protein